MVIIIVIVITSALYQDSRINFCRKKKEHADTPPSEAEHMVCEVNENIKKRKIKKMVCEIYQATMRLVLTKLMLKLKLVMKVNTWFAK